MYNGADTGLWTRLKHAQTAETEKSGTSIPSIVREGAKVHVGTSGRVKMHIKQLDACLRELQHRRSRDKASVVMDNVIDFEQHVQKKRLFPVFIGA
jgi:hypothetical protein